MICFVFPGQGSQRERMGENWVDHPSWELVAEASEVAERDLTHLLLTASTEELSNTRNTQIATFLMSMIALDSIERLGVSPQLCAGHSLGEYSALVASGALTFDAAVKIVVERGEAMQRVAEEIPGAMAAVLGSSDDQILDLCREIGPELFIANYNSDGQTVMAGSFAAIDRLSEIGSQFGAKRVIRLPVGGAFHTPLIKSARPKLAKAINAVRFYNADVPIIANVDAKKHEAASEWPSLLLEQLCSPVKWKQTMALIANERPNLVVEVGPGGVLTGLVKRALPGTPVLSVAKPEDLEILLETVASEGPFHDWATSHHGERFYVSERLVVSPASGVFTPDGKLEGESVYISVGQVIGNVGDVDVRSPFSGNLQGVVAVEGERVIMGQPIAWLRNEGL